MKRSLRFALLLTTVFAAVRLVAAEPAELASLRAKAEKGNALAQYNLGLAYAQGQQVSADLPQAFMWLSLASENGSTGKALETVLGSINDEQLAEGRRLLAANRAAYAARAAAPAMSRSNFRKLTNRSFSLTPRSDTTETQAIQPVASAKETVVAAVDPVLSDKEQLSRMRQENSQLRADLARAANQIESQAEAIARLQDQLAGKRQAAVVILKDPSGNSAGAGMIVAGPVR